MNYMKKDPKATVDVKNVLPILISADFLQICTLVQTCLTFVQEHLSSVVRLPIDMKCLNSGLQRRLADLVPIK